MKKFVKNKKGFSLIEITIAVAIMAVLAAIFVPSFINYLNDSKIKKDEIKFQSMCTALETSLSDREVRLYVEKTFDNNDMTLEFEINDGYIDFKTGKLTANDTEVQFKDSKIGLNSFQAMGTNYQLEQTKSAEGKLTFTLTPKKPNTTAEVTYNLELPDDE